MLIERFGIRLIKLKEEHIEEVRNHRNTPAIRNFMEYKEFITCEMQKQWFSSLDDATDFYFVIEYQSEKIGLIHTSGIDWAKKEGHAGLFIWKEKYLSTHIPVLASLSMVDFFFQCCTLEEMFAKVMTTNAVAVKYNINLGFVPAQSGKKSHFQEYVLVKENYFKTSARLHEMADKLPEKKYRINMEIGLFNLLKNLNAIAPGNALIESTVLSLTS